MRKASKVEVYFHRRTHLRRISVTSSHVSGVTGVYTRVLPCVFVSCRSYKLLTMTFKTRETGFPAGSALHLGTGPAEELLNRFNLRSRVSTCLLPLPDLQSPTRPLG